MTRDDLRSWMQDHGMGPKALARLVSVNYRTTRRWYYGQQPIPPALRDRLERVTPDEIEEAR